MIMRYSLLLRFCFSSDISMFLAVIWSIVIPFFNVSFFNIPIPPPIEYFTMFSAYVFITNMLAKIFVTRNKLTS